MGVQYHNNGNSEVQQKQALAYLLAASATTGVAATGVIDGLVVAQTASASGSVLISAGASVNQGSLGQGADLIHEPSQVTLDVFTANPMGGVPRNDIVVMDSVTSSITVVVGTPNATPTDPTVAATRTPLARLRHAASATTIPTAKIDDLRVITSLRQESAAWKLYSPQLIQGVARGISVDYARYQITGKTIRGNIRLTSTGNGTPATVISVTAPAFNAASGGGTVGTFVHRSALSGIRRSGSCYWDATQFKFIVDNTTDFFGATPNYGLVVGDTMMLEFQMETA